MKVVVCILVFIVAIQAAPFQWKSCDPNAKFQISNVTMVPYPGIAGKNTTIYSEGKLTETVTGGSWTAKFYLDGLNVKTYNGNACELIPSCPCPCKPGSYTGKLVLPVPSFALTDTYTGKFTSTDAQGNSLLCVDSTFDIKSS